MNIIRRIVEWYRRNFVPYIAICAATEQVYISKALWHEIVDRLPLDKRSDIRVFFEKYPIEGYVGQGSKAFRYRFFVNADLSNVKTPEGEEPFTTQIQFSQFGHIGFQCVQPTPIEILTEYGYADFDFCTSHLSEMIRLKVKIGHLDETDEVYYIVTPNVVGSLL